MLLAYLPSGSNTALPSIFERHLLTLARRRAFAGEKWRGGSSVSEREFKMFSASRMSFAGVSCGMAPAINSHRLRRGPERRLAWLCAGWRNRHDEQAGQNDSSPAQ